MLIQEPIATTRTRERLIAALPVKERRLELSGIPTAVLEGGEGAPVVLLHGPGEYAAKWLRVIPHLVKTHHVVAPDLPGHGASEVPDGRLDAERVLGWLEELIEHTCRTPPVLVGQILGGAIAARFASSRGARLKRLVLADSLGLVPFQPAPEFGAALSAFLSAPNETTHDGLWSRCAFNLDRLRNALGERWQLVKAYNVELARLPENKPAQQALMAQFGFPAIAPAELEKIAVPTTLIWGRHDLATALTVAEEASARYGWGLEVIEDAADDPPMEQPEAFLKALRTALGAPQSQSAAKETQAAWDHIAAGYSEFVTPTHFSLGSQGLSRAGIASGTRFLDVAAGSGALSIPAARLGAQVLATDISPAMLQRLAASARGQGLSNIETRVMDGHALELDDESFDAAGSQFGVMLFPDMPRAVREMARVTRRGGRVLIIAFGDPREVEFLAFFFAAVRSVIPGFTGFSMEDPPLPFQLRDPERLRRELSAAGLGKVRIETLTETLEFHSGAQLWGWLVNSNPVVGTILAGLRLSEEQIIAVRQALERMVRERAGGSRNAVLTSPINIGIGTK